jgi:hypothetical protein
MVPRYCGHVDVDHLHLPELLDFRPNEGIIRLHEQRVVILSAAAMTIHSTNDPALSMERNINSRTSSIDASTLRGGVRGRAPATLR